MTLGTQPLEIEFQAFVNPWDVIELGRNIRQVPRANSTCLFLATHDFVLYGLRHMFPFRRHQMFDHSQASSSDAAAPILQIELPHEVPDILKKLWGVV